MIHLQTYTCFVCKRHTEKKTVIHFSHDRTDSLNLYIHYECFLESSGKHICVNYTIEGWEEVAGKSNSIRICTYTDDDAGITGIFHNGKLILDNLSSM